MRRQLRIILVLSAILLLNTEAVASDEIKIQTFQRFAKVAGFEKQYYQMISIFVSSFQQGLVAGFMDDISRDDIPSEKREKLNILVNEASQILKTDLEKMYKSEIDFNDLVTNVYLPVYRKRFTETEIKELINFYNSHLGKKISELTPIIMQDSSDRYNQIYGQRVQKLGGELMYSEINKLISRVKEI